jgi:hypothetical protein
MRHLNQQPEPSPAIQSMYEWGASANKQVRAVLVEKTQARDPQVVDDQVEHGQSDFEGKHIHFGSDDFPKWNNVVEYLMSEKDFIKVSNYRDQEVYWGC